MNQIQELRLVMTALLTLAGLPFVKIEWEQDSVTITANKDGHMYLFELKFEHSSLRFYLEAGKLPNVQLKANARVDNEWVFYNLVIPVEAYIEISKKIEELYKNNTLKREKAWELFGLPKEGY